VYLLFQRQKIIAQSLTYSSASHDWSPHILFINSREWAWCCDSIQWIRCVYNL